MCYIPGANNEKENYDKGANNEHIKMRKGAIKYVKNLPIGARYVRMSINSNRRRSVYGTKCNAKAD